jgi:hypothetical protein
MGCNCTLQPTWRGARLIQDWTMNLCYYGQDFSALIHEKEDSLKFGGKDLREPSCSRCKTEHDSERSPLDNPPAPRLHPSH